jgi:F-type H+-transporting ATPase subunit epsilon
VDRGQVSLAIHNQSNAMANDLTLSVVAPDRKVVETQVFSVTAPGHDGYLGVLAGHEPSLIALRPGLLEFRDTRDQRHFVAIGGGFMEVSGNQVIILADDARLASEIEVKKEEEMLDRARRTLRGEATGLSQEEATLELERALTRIKAARMN